MKKINILLISAVLSVVLFVVLTIIQNNIINSEPKIRVITANADVRRNSEIKENMIREIEVPLSLTLNTNMVTSIEEIKGRYAREDIYAGQIIFKQEIATSEEIKLLEVNNGEKIAVKVKSPENGVSYQIRQGDKVNLYFSGRYGGIKETIRQYGFPHVEKGDEAMYTMKLLNQAEIVGVYDEYGRNENSETFSNPDTVIFSVDSKNAEIISNLRQLGTFDITKN